MVIANNKEELRRISDHFEDKEPVDILKWIIDTYETGSVAMATGFGAEGTVLIDMIAKLNRKIPIFFIDTDALFKETYDLRSQLEKKYGIKFIRYSPYLSMAKQNKIYGEELWKRNPDLCCYMRKVEPLRNALQNYYGWITAIRREQTTYRANAGIVEWDEKFGLIKINPLARWTKEQVQKHILDNDIPTNPLSDNGYTSIGCTHCTTKSLVGETDRTGRWRGMEKTECGLHIQYAVQHNYKTGDQ